MNTGNQIPGVEERMAGEQGILDGVGMGIEDVIAREGLALGIASSRLGHICLPGHVKTNTPLYVDRQARSPH